MPILATENADILWAAYYSSLQSQYAPALPVGQFFQVFSHGTVLPLPLDNPKYDAEVKRSLANRIVEGASISSQFGDGIEVGESDFGVFSAHSLVQSYEIFLDQLDVENLGGKALERERQKFDNRNTIEYSLAEDGPIEIGEDQRILTTRNDIIQSGAGAKLIMNSTDLTKEFSSTSISGGVNVGKFFGVSGNLGGSFSETRTIEDRAVAKIEIGFTGGLSAEARRGDWINPSFITWYKDQFSEDSRHKLFSKDGILPGIITQVVLCHGPRVKIEFEDYFNDEEITTIKASSKIKIGPFTVGKIRYNKREEKTRLIIDRASLEFVDESPTIYVVGCYFNSFS